MYCNRGCFVFQGLSLQFHLLFYSLFISSLLAVYDYHHYMLFSIRHPIICFKGTDWPKQIWLKNDFLHAFLLFYVRLLCSINFCFGPVEMRQFKNNCIGLKIDWGSPPGCSYLRNAYYVITCFCFTQVFVDSAYKQLTMALSQARNLLRSNNLSDDLTDDCVNNSMSFFE